MRVIYQDVYDSCHKLCPTLIFILLWFVASHCEKRQFIEWIFLDVLPTELFRPPVIRFKIYHEFMCYVLRKTELLFLACDDVISYIMTYLLTSLPPSSPPSPPCGKIRMISMTVVKALSYIACSLTRAAGKRKDKGVFCKPSFEEVKATRCNMCLCAVNRYICPEWSRMWEWFILGKCRVQITALSHGNTSFLLRHFRKMSV